MYVDIYTDRKSLQYIFKQKELNLRQWRWLELLKDYDVSILYHPGKVNVVADALSHRSMGSLCEVPLEKNELIHELHQLANLGVRVIDSGSAGIGINDPTVSSLNMEVKERQYEDPQLSYYRGTFHEKEKSPLEIFTDGILRYRGRLCIPNVAKLRRRILEEAHYSRYSIHPGGMKMYHDLKLIYWWDGMKRDIAEFVRRDLR